MNIIFLDENTITLGDIDFSSLKKLGDYKSCNSNESKNVISVAGNAEIIITNKVRITRDIIAGLPQLKLVTVIATGYNNVDIIAARELGVAVCNVPGYAGNSVPQHTFALLLNLVTKIHLYQQDIQKGEWHKSETFTLLNYPTFELSGKTLGIVGFGTIGRGVAKIAKAFGMKVIVYDINSQQMSDYQSVDFETLLRDSDVITLHCPLTPDNKHLINADSISKMKKNALLINTARGPLVDENALYDALNSGRISGAGLDVLEQEPPTKESKILNAKNLFCSPHSAWSTIEARQKLVDETAINIKAFMEGSPRNVVNQDS